MKPRQAAKRTRERMRKWVAEGRFVKPAFGNGCSFSPDGFVTRRGYVSIVPG